METCENCGKVIGKLEVACIYQGNVVCPDCDSRLRGNIIEPIRPISSTIKPNEIKTNVKRGAEDAAAACIILACLAAVFGSGAWNFVVMPLFLAAFILSIVAMAQNRICAGLFVMILTLITAYFFGIW
jgi:hypothetical protein